jgi:LysM repeat protein
VVFIGPNENGEFLYKIHVAINVSLAALPKGSKLRNDVAFKTQNSAQVLNAFPLLHLLHFPTF